MFPLMKHSDTYNVDEVCKKGEVLILCRDRKVMRSTHPNLAYAKLNNPIGLMFAEAKSDLSPGDIVEIVGDYAVKVGGTKTYSNVIVQAGTTIMPRLSMSTGQFVYDEAPPSSVAADAAPSQSECKCPFGPNLGPIEHVTSCKEYKS